MPAGGNLPSYLDPRRLQLDHRDHVPRSRCRIGKAPRSAVQVRQRLELTVPLDEVLAPVYVPTKADRDHRGVNAAAGVGDHVGQRRRKAHRVRRRSTHPLDRRRIRGRHKDLKVKACRLLQRVPEYLAPSDDRVDLSRGHKVDLDGTLFRAECRSWCWSWFRCGRSCLLARDQRQRNHDRYEHELARTVRHGFLSLLSWMDRTRTSTR